MKNRKIDMDNNRTHIVVAVIGGISLIIAAVITGVFAYQSNDKNTAIVVTKTKDTPTETHVTKIPSSVGISIDGEKSFSIILPEDISEKIEQIKEEFIEYPDRDRDMEILNDGIKNGDFYTANSFADRIIDRQNNLRNITNIGISELLKDKLNIISNERIDYPDRNRDMKIMNEGIKNGDLGTANSFAERIIERQRNLRGIKQKNI